MNFNYGGSLFTIEDEFSSDLGVTDGTWELQDKTLILSDSTDSYEVEYSVIELDSDYLKLKLSFVNSDDSSGIMTNVSMDLTMTFTR